jgi:hypothetical protein
MAKQNILTAKNSTQVFANIEQILGVNVDFLSLLEYASSNLENGQKFADCFRMMV